MKGYDNIKAKIQKLAEENELSFSFFAAAFPLRFVFTTIENSGQITFNDNAAAKKEKTCIEFVFTNRLYVNIDKGFVISDELYGKLKNLCKKLHYVFLWRYHRYLEHPQITEVEREEHVNERGERDLTTEYITERRV